MEINLVKRNAKVTISKMPSIYAVPSQIRQLFQNLISNSLKFCREGSTPEIHIQTEVIKGAHVPGVDRKYLRTLFIKSISVTTVLALMQNTLKKYS
jgi:signal transduction histidine kinase